MPVAFPISSLVQMRRPLQLKAAPPLAQPAQRRSIVALFDWTNDYNAGNANPDIVVAVNTFAGGQGSQIPFDQIRSVKIDNTGNPFPVYLQFIDSGDLVTCPGNAIVWDDVLTAGRLANVFMQGAVTGLAGTTEIWFNNFSTIPAVNSEQPQLGIQTSSQSILDITAANQNVVLFGGPRSSGYFYVTNLALTLLDADSASGAPIPTNISMEGDAFGALFAWRWIAQANTMVSFNINFRLYEANSLNLRLPATDTWRLKNTAGLGGAFAQANIIMVFRTIP